MEGLPQQKMDLVHVDDGKYTKYEKMILERDRYRKKAECAFNEYMRVFGDQITAVFKQKIICIRIKKMISYCMLYINRGEDIDLKEVLVRIKVEMTEYEKQLQEMIDQNEFCKKGKEISENDFLRIKQIYRRIAKKLHPDLNPLTEQHEELLELWQRSVIAYRYNNLNEIEEIEVLVERALAELGLGKTKIDLPDLDEKIEAVRAEIAKIKSTDPYLYSLILNNPNLVKEKKQELADELNEYKEYAAELRKELKKFVIEEGTFVWEN